MIFVAKTSWIKRVKCINFQIRNKYAQKVCLQILIISIVQICSIGCIQKNDSFFENSEYSFKTNMSHSQMLGKVEYGLSAKI